MLCWYRYLIREYHGKGVMCRLCENFSKNIKKMKEISENIIKRKIW
jgi:hypothetical protein